MKRYVFVAAALAVATLNIDSNGRGLRLSLGSPAHAWCIHGCKDNVHQCNFGCPPAWGNLSSETALVDALEAHVRDRIHHRCKIMNITRRRAFTCGWSIVQQEYRDSLKNHASFKDPKKFKKFLSRLFNHPAVQAKMTESANYWKPSNPAAQLEAFKDRVMDVVGKMISAVFDGIRTLATGAAATTLFPFFHAYIETNRMLFLKDAKPLTPKEKVYLKKLFPTKLVDRVRVLERNGETSYFNTGAGATTLGADFIIIKKGQRSNNILKHEMVHVCQYTKLLGVPGFAFEYARQFIDGGFKYDNIRFEKEAYAFQNGPDKPISKHPGYSYCK